MWQKPSEYQENVESMRVSKTCSGEYPKTVQPMWVPKNERIRVSTRKKKNPCKYPKTVRVSTGKGSNQCEYWKIAESGWVPGKSRIRVSIEKLFGWVPGKGPINVSTYKWQNPGEYQEKVESVRVSKNCSGEFGKRVQLMWEPKNGRNRVSTRKM